MEELTVSIIRETAKQDLHMIQPMIKALRNNNLSEIMKYEDISINLEEISSSYQRNIELAGIIQESFKERKKDIELKRKSTIESLVIDLSEMDIFNNIETNHIRDICERVVKNSSINEEYGNQKIEALKECMMLNERLKGKEKNKSKEKLKDGLISIYELSRDKNIHPYELLKRSGFIKNPVDEFLEVN